MDHDDVVGWRTLVLGCRDDDHALGTIVAIAYFVLHGRANDARRPLALEILDERFAKGELSSEEYERSRATLDGRPLGRSEAVRR